MVKTRYPYLATAKAGYYYLRKRDPTRDNSHLAHISCADIPGTKRESRKPLIGLPTPRSLATAAGIGANVA